MNNILLLYKAPSEDTFFTLHTLTKATFFFFFFFKCMQILRTVHGLKRLLDRQHLFCYKKHSRISFVTIENNLTFSHKNIPNRTVKQALKQFVSFSSLPTQRPYGDMQQLPCVYGLQWAQSKQKTYVQTVF